MVLGFKHSALLALLSCNLDGAFAFVPNNRVQSFHRTKSSLEVSVDPEVVTKDEYRDICGVSFDNESLEKRLERTSYLYPKHVEAIEDFSDVVDKMVDEIVSII